MKIQDILQYNRQLVIDRWFKAMIDNYPKDAGKFLIEKHKQFSNPIGFAIAENLPPVYDSIANPEKFEIPKQALENIIKIHAVQNISASEAISFIFKLKDILRESNIKQVVDNKFYVEYLKIESNIDRVTMAAFDIYMQNRELLYEIKANEVRNRTHKIVERLNKKYGYEGE